MNFPQQNNNAWADLGADPQYAPRPIEGCNHPNVAVRTVNKEGPNKGRQFRSCTNRQCQKSFLGWVDGGQNNSPATAQSFPTAPPTVDINPIMSELADIKTMVTTIGSIVEGLQNAKNDNNTFHLSQSDITAMKEQ